jgi:hypothetical protein
VQQSVCVHGKGYVRVGLELKCYRELAKRNTVSFELGGAIGWYGARKEIEKKEQLCIPALKDIDRSVR